MKRELLEGKRDRTPDEMLRAASRLALVAALLIGCACILIAGVLVAAALRANPCACPVEPSRATSEQP